MSRFRQIALLFALLISSSLWAGEAAPPSQGMQPTTFGDANLQPKIQIAKGERKDTLLMSEAAADTIVPKTVQEAQTVGVEIDVDKKIIRPQVLGLSAGNTLQEILLLIPELLDRGNEDLLSRYTLQLDDIGVGQSKDVVLTTLRAGEIDYIEIMHSPTVSVQQNGEGGVINVHLKPVEQHFHGSAMADVYTNFHNTVDLSPSVYFTYGGKKWQLRANLVMEYYRPTTFTQTDTRVHNILISNARDTTTWLRDTTITNFLQQTAKVQFDYQPSDQDRLTFSLWESMQWETSQSQSLTTIFRPFETAGMPSLWQQTDLASAQAVNTKRANLTAMARYKRLYLTGGELQVDMIYNYGYRADATEKGYAAVEGTIPAQQYAHTTDSPHEWQVNIQTKHAIAPERLGLYDSEMWLTAGVNGIYTYRNSHLLQHAEGQMFSNGYHQDLGLRKQQAYISPLLQWDYRIGSVKMQAGVRYQMLCRTLLTNSQPDWTGIDHDWTGSLNAAWAITRKHTLQLNIARNILRPEDQQLFPYPYYLPASQEIVIGNDSLHAACFHSVGVNYLFRHPFAKEEDGRLVLHAGVDYIRADGLVTEITRLRKDNSAIPYHTFENQESSNAMSLSGSLFLRYRIFSMSVAANTYVNCKAKSDYYWYYNLSFSPCFAFRNQWLLSGKIMYNSKIEMSDSYIGDCFYLQLRLSKTIGKWTIHASIDDVFDQKTVDRSTHNLSRHVGINESAQNAGSTHQQQEITERTYDLYKRLVMLGVIYKF